MFVLIVPHINSIRENKMTCGKDKLTEEELMQHMQAAEAELNEIVDHLESVNQKLARVHGDVLHFTSDDINNGLTERCALAKKEIQFAQDNYISHLINDMKKACGYISQS